VALAATTLALTLFAAAASSPEAPSPTPHPLLGLEVRHEALDAAGERRALEAVQKAGAPVVALSLSWADAEKKPGRFDFAELRRAARILRQSGMEVHLDLPLVRGLSRSVPQDLASLAFDDEKLTVRLGAFFDALEPVLLDVSTLSLGEDADVYFAENPDQLKAFRRLFEGAVQFLARKLPELKVGIATLAPTESPDPATAAALHSRSPVLFFTYVPFVVGRPYRHRPPETLDADWSELLQRSAGRPIAFLEVSYSSAEANNSSPQAQADFVRRLRRFAANADGRRLLFIRYVGLRDEPAPPEQPGASELARLAAAFHASRGLLDSSGRPKPAWRAWAGRAGGVTR
jgi:hypothetical protein